MHADVFLSSDYLTEKRDGSITLRERGGTDILVERVKLEGQKRAEKNWKVLILKWEIHGVKFELRLDRDYMYHG